MLGVTGCAQKCDDCEEITAAFSRPLPPRVCLSADEGREALQLATCVPLLIYLVFLTDIVQLETPRMGPDSAEHLEILEKLCARTASSPLQGRTDTCSGKEAVCRVTTT